MHLFLSFSIFYFVVRLLLPPSFFFCFTYVPLSPLPSLPLYSFRSASKETLGVGVAVWQRDLKLRRSFSDPKFFRRRLLSLFYGSNSSSIDENGEPVSAYRLSVKCSFVCSSGNLGCGFVGKQIWGWVCWVRRMMEVGKKARF